MAGVFGLFDFTKPGPGVEKDEPEKVAFLRFFQIYFRKFWYLVRVNMLYAIFNLPAIIVSFFTVSLLITMFSESGYLFPQDIEGISSDQLFLFETSFRYIISTIFVVFPIICVGPATAGFTYIMRNYAREENAFIWTDFKKHAKLNFKQSIIISFINFFMMITLAIAYNFYIQFQGTTGIILSGVILAMFVILMMMNIYIFPMMISFKYSIKQLLKNALIFTFSKFFTNLLIILIGIIVGVLPFILHTFVASILTFCFSFSFVGFLTNFYAWNNINKYLIRPNKSKMTEE